VLGKQLQPFREAPLIEQRRFKIKEILHFLAGG
jgi:hypothetical protein